MATHLKYIFDFPTHVWLVGIFVVIVIATIQTN